MRYSHQREVIRGIICSTKSHPTADWIYSEAKKKINNISLGTVYRNLKTLEEIGAIQIIYDENLIRYDGNIEVDYGSVTQLWVQTIELQRVQSTHYHEIGPLSSVSSSGRTL